MSKKINIPTRDDFISKLMKMSPMEMNDFIKQNGKKNEKISLFTYLDDDIDNLTTLGGNQNGKTKS